MPEILSIELERLRRVLFYTIQPLMGRACSSGLGCDIDLLSSF